MMPYRIGLCLTSARSAGGAHATCTRDGSSVRANAFVEIATQQTDLNQDQQVEFINMLVLIAQGVNLTEEQFAQEVATRRTALNLAEGQSTLGCPLCAFSRIPGRPPLPTAPAAGPAVRQQ